MDKANEVDNKEGFSLNIVQIAEILDLVPEDVLLLKPEDINYQVELVMNDWMENPKDLVAEQIPRFLITTVTLTSIMENLITEEEDIFDEVSTLVGKILSGEDYDLNDKQVFYKLLVSLKDRLENPMPTTQLLYYATFNSKRLVLEEVTVLVSYILSINRFMSVSLTADDDVYIIPDRYVSGMIRFIEDGREKLEKYDNNEELITKLETVLNSAGLLPTPEQIPYTSEERDIIEELITLIEPEPYKED